MVTIPFGKGRPTNVYYVGSIRQDTVPHEAWLSYVLLMLHFKLKCPFVRGLDVDPAIRADATVTIATQTVHAELDRGTVDYRRVVERYGVYEAALKSADEYVLWIAPTQSRMDGLRRRAERIADHALFTTFEKALREWVDFNGNVVQVPVPR